MCFKPTYTTGVEIFNADLISEQKTIVISGVGRSGTTAMTRVLHASGLPKTGDRRITTEDDYMFGPLMVKGEQDAFIDNARALDAQFNVWGFKWHLAWFHNPMLNLLRNPVMVLMVRDSLSIAQRAAATDKSLTIHDWLSSVLRWQSEMWSWTLRQTTIPIILVSYEKLCAKPAIVIELITGVLGMPLTQAAVDCVIREDPRYVERLRNFERTGEA